MGLSYSVLGDVWANAGGEFGWDGASGVFMEAAECPWDVWGEIPAEKGMDSGFLGCYHSACPRASRRNMSPGEIRHPLSFEGRDVTAGVTGPAPISSCSPLAFRI